MKEHGNIKKYYCISCECRISLTVKQKCEGMCRDCYPDYLMNFAEDDAADAVSVTDES